MEIKKIIFKDKIQSIELIQEKILNYLKPNKLI